MSLRKGGREAASGSQLRDKLDPSAVGLDQPPGEGEPKARALLPDADLADLAELLEDQRLVRRRDPGSGVGDGHPHEAVVGDGLDRDRSAVRGELDRVRQEVVQDLADAATVRDESIDGAEIRDRQVLPFGQRPESGDRFGHQAAEVERRPIELETARLDLGQVENLVDQREEVQPARVDVLDPLIWHEPAVALARLRPHELGEPKDGRERRPELVTHVCDEVALGLARGNQALREESLFGVQLFPLGQRHRLRPEQVDQGSVLETEERPMVSKQHNRGSIGRQCDDRYELGVDGLAEISGDLVRGSDRLLRCGACIGEQGLVGGQRPAARRTRGVQADGGPEKAGGSVQTDDRRSLGTGDLSRSLRKPGPDGA